MIRVSRHIKNIGLPSSLKNLNINNIDPEVIWQIMKKDKKVNKDQTIELIVIKTRQYSKRQATWARGQMKDWDQ